MENQTKPSLSHTLGWLIVAFCALAGLAIGVHTLLNFNRASILIEWATESEIDTVGFNILRSVNEEGPYDTINSALIPPASDPVTGGDYTFKDDDVQVGETYYYFLEEVQVDGQKNIHGPIQQIATSSRWSNLSLAGVLLATAGYYAWALKTSRQNSLSTEPHD